MLKPRGISPVVNPFDENALETAIRIKESCGARITIISLGNNLSKAIFLKALATGADKMVLIEDRALDPSLLDSHATAKLLAAAIKKFDDYDLLLTSRQASDTNAGQVGLLLSGYLLLASQQVFTGNSTERSARLISIRGRLLAAFIDVILG